MYLSAIKKKKKKKIGVSSCIRFPLPFTVQIFIVFFLCLLFVVFVFCCCFGQDVNVCLMNLSADFSFFVCVLFFCFGQAFPFPFSDVMKLLVFFSLLFLLLVRLSTFPFAMS